MTRSEHGIMANTTDDNCSSPILQYQKDTILCILGGVSIAALVSCTAGLAVICYSRLYQEFTHRLVSYQVVGAFVFSATTGSQLLLLQYSPKDHHTLCVAEGVLLTYTVWVKLLFLACLTLHLFLQVCCFVTYRRWLEVTYVVVSVAVPLGICFIPFIHNSYGIAGAWCWIKGWYNDCPADHYDLGIGLQFGVLYIPALVWQLAIVIMIICVVVTWLRLAYGRENNETQMLVNRTEKRNRIKHVFKWQILPLVPYPLLFFGFFIPPFVNRTINETTDTLNYGAFIAHAISVPCWGLSSGMTSLVYAIAIIIITRRRAHTITVVDFNEVTPTPSSSTRAVQVEPVLNPPSSTPLNFWYVTTAHPNSGYTC